MSCGTIPVQVTDMNFFVTYFWKKKNQFLWWSWTVLLEKVSCFHIEVFLSLSLSTTTTFPYGHKLNTSQFDVVSCLLWAVESGSAQQWREVVPCLLPTLCWCSLWPQRLSWSHHYCICGSSVHSYFAPRILLTNICLAKKCSQTVDI